MTAPPSGTALRPSRLYVTSGLSNPRDDDEPGGAGEPSGLGAEFVFEMTEPGDTVTEACASTSRRSSY